MEEPQHKFAHFYFRVRQIFVEPRAHTCPGRFTPPAGGPGLARV